MDLKTLVKIRGTARASVTRIISKCRNILEQNLAEKEAELMIVFQNLKKKNQNDLKQINREVIMLLDEEELENDVIQCEQIE